jgi:formylglycine-generating enzyme required for sulfatase activity
MIPVIFNVTPPDARIKVGSLTFVSGKAQSLPMGKNEVIIEKEGYRSKKETIEVSKTNIQFNYNLEQIDVVLVKFKSSPDEASLIVNNTGKGKTNKDLFLFPGRYDIKLIKDNYLDVNESILVTESGDNTFTYNMTKKSGFLKLSVKPDNAKVLINNESVSDFKIVELSPGQYKVEVRADAYDTKYEMIEIKLGESIEKQIVLQPRYGSLMLSVSPSEANIEISRNNIKVKSLTGSQIVKDLLEGEYQVSAKAQGYKSYTSKIMIENQRRTELNIEMQKGSDVPDTFVLVEGGTFNNGLANVTVSSFYIGKYEVTQKEWKAVMGNNPSNFKGDKRPVEQITWYQAVEFCNKLSQKEGLTPAYTINGTSVSCNWNANGYRLPTEAEWEFAARGGKLSKGYTYSGSNNLDEVGWYSSNSSSQTKDVGTKRANELGIYDMSGDVWEWCWDCYGHYSLSTQTNPTGATSGSNRVIRGGSWNKGGYYCRVANRDYNYPYYSFNYLGFRLSRTIR